MRCTQSWPRMASGICPREREASIVLRWRHARRRPAPSVHGRIATASQPGLSPNAGSFWHQAHGRPGGGRRAGPSTRCRHFPWCDTASSVAHPVAAKPGCPETSALLSSQAAWLYWQNSRFSAYILRLSCTGDVRTIWRAGGILNVPRGAAIRSSPFAMLAGEVPAAGDRPIWVTG